MRGTKRRRFRVSGIVQGVGFRPFLHRLARRFALAGWVRNTPAGVEGELEGDPAGLDAFLAAVRRDPPPLAVVEAVEAEPLPTPAGYRGFVIRPSAGGAGATLVAPDLAPCPACLREMDDPADRRYRYPFINCTDCGPRFTILQALPYDRANTTMAGFAMCPACAAEYRDIASRRYHAQPNACPVCGPRAFYLDAAGRPVDGDPVALAQRTLAAGGILAVKGAGGIHLACDGRSAAAVRRLRRRKHRPDKPLALLCRDLGEARRFCRIDETAAALLQSPRRPILLLEKRDPDAWRELSATDRLGILLPYTPLHRLLADGTAGGPAAMVLTSANRPGCPVLIDNDEALAALAGVADGYLLHDRPIRNRCDDSVAMVWQGAPYFLRRSRGWVPQPVLLDRAADGMVAFGAEQKAGFAAGRGRHAFLSQHIGDLKNAETLDHYRGALDTCLGLFRITPRLLVCDRHPDYASTREAEARAAAAGLPLLQVQHHWAHMAACMADNRLAGPVFGLVWDGTGLGTDGTIWGGECLAGDLRGYTRLGAVRPIPLAGGDAAAREIARTALALLLDAGLDPALAPLPPDRCWALTALLQSGLPCPRSGSIGRLFDGVYALITGTAAVSYEGMAAERLEALVRPGLPGRTYPLAFYEEAAPGGRLRRFDPRPMIRAIAADRAAGRAPGAIARGFLDALCELALDQCRALNPKRLPVVLTGGVFLDRYLLAGITRRLTGAGFTVFCHRRVSPGDEGLPLGQLAIAAARANREG